MGRENLGLSRRQRRQLWEMDLQVIRGVMEVWCKFKSSSAKVKHGLEIAYMIKQTLDAHKDVVQGKFLSPPEFRQKIWASLSELETYLEPYRQKQLKQKIAEIEIESQTQHKDQS